MSKIGICFFIESNLGGAGTQACDLVKVAKRLGHDAGILMFTQARRSPRIFDIRQNSIPVHDLKIGSSGMRMDVQRILLVEETKERVFEYLETFDLLLFVGGCPHITRTFAVEDFYNLYEPIYQSSTKKIVFLTDPFWPKLYPYLKDVLPNVDRVYAFAEAYKNAVVESGLSDDVGICNFGSIVAYDYATNLSPVKRKNRIIWPHQWRSWKNPELMINLAPHLSVPIDAYADGIEYHKLRRDRWVEYSCAVSYDHVKNETLNPEGKVTVHGTVPQSRIMKEFSSCRWMIDFTGMSGRTGEPMKKFIGNYQCVNIECMMLGCVNIKYRNTIHPTSQIPEDCVLPIDNTTDIPKLAQMLNESLTNSNYERISSQAREWALEEFNPLKVFESCFTSPFNL